MRNHFACYFLKDTVKLVEYNKKHRKTIKYNFILSMGC